MTIPVNIPGMNAATNFFTSAGKPEPQRRLSRLLQSFSQLLLTSDCPFNKETERRRKSKKTEDRPLCSRRRVHKIRPGCADRKATRLDRRSDTSRAGISAILGFPKETKNNMESSRVIITSLSDKWAKFVKGEYRKI